MFLNRILFIYFFKISKIEQENDDLVYKPCVFSNAFFFSYLFFQNLW
jgi:hypothetical protein